jgi:hypothetical protein
MKRVISLIGLSAWALLLNCCVVQNEVKLWNRSIPEEEKIPIMTRTTGKLTFQKSKHSVVATIKCPDWPWFEMKATWPDAAPFIEQADVEVMEEKWLGGERLVALVISNGKTVYDASICEKHQVPMARKDASYAEGRDYPVKEGTATPKLFPNAGVYYLYGCGSGLTPTVWRCPACYEGFELWTKRLGISEF